MIYKNICTGKFISRPNRFIAEVEISGEIKICHVKNTGRCKELLVPGATVFLEKSDNLARKTEYDLVAVYKGEKLINMDSQAPNKVFGEWVQQGDYFKNITLVKPEYKYKNSRMDFYIETENKKILAEIKGVTLEENGVVMFPDAPTERGIKHIKELMGALAEGYESYIFFIVQMEDCKYFTPAYDKHPEFAKVLKEAHKKGVKVIALNCTVTHSELKIKGEIPVKF